MGEAGIVLRSRESKKEPELFWERVRVWAKRDNLKSRDARESRGSPWSGSAYGCEGLPGNSSRYGDVGEECSSPTSVGIRRRPTLPGRYQPSTISAWRLNCCVRYGNRWNPPAIATGKRMTFLGDALGFVSPPLGLLPVGRPAALVLPLCLTFQPVLTLELTAFRDVCNGRRVRCTHPENRTGKVT